MENLSIEAHNCLAGRKENGIWNVDFGNFRYENEAIISFSWLTGVNNIHYTH